jgi:hypothetical protein
MMVNLMTAAGWRVECTFQIATDALQDAEREIDLAINEALPTAAALEQPPKLMDLLARLGDLLRVLTGGGPGPPLRSFAFTAERRPWSSGSA